MLVIVAAHPVTPEPAIAGQRADDVVPLPLKQFLRTDHIGHGAADQFDHDRPPRRPALRPLVRGITDVERHDLQRFGHGTDRRERRHGEHRHSA